MTEGEFLSDNQLHEIGGKIGEAIRLLLEVIADLSNVLPEDVWEELVESYIAQRIIDAD